MRGYFSMRNPQKIDGFIESSEVWLAADMKPGERPRDSANRKEAVVVVGRQITAGKMETLVKVYDIIRSSTQVDLVVSPTQPPNTDDLHAWYDPYLDTLHTSGSD